MRLGRGDQSEFQYKQVNNSQHLSDQQTTRQPNWQVAATSGQQGARLKQGFLETCRRKRARALMF